MDTIEQLRQKAQAIKDVIREHRDIIDELRLELAPIEEELDRAERRLRESKKNQRHEVNAMIFKDFIKGESIQSIAKRHGVSVSSITIKIKQAWRKDYAQHQRAMYERCGMVTLTMLRESPPLIK